MHGIHYVGFFSTLAIAALYIALARKRVPADERGMMLALAGMTFLMPGLAYYGVRLPLDDFIKTQLDPKGAAYMLVKLWYAPITEELAKLWPLLLPVVNRWVDHDRAPRAAYALGLGFGVGEVAFLAVLLGADPSSADTPWYHYTGFVTERVLATPCHALFVFMGVCAWRRWNWPAGLFLGFLCGATLHFALNAPILLAIKGYLGSKEVAGHLLMIWILWFFVATITVFARTLGTKRSTAGGFFFGETDCNLCGVHYERPFWGFNLGVKRYERCPSCKKWHLQ